MELSSPTTAQKLISALRSRAQKLRQQAIWAQQANADAYGKCHLTYFVEEVLALREESMVLDQLADQYESKYGNTHSEAA